MNVIEVNNISKKYIISHKTDAKSLYNTLGEFVGSKIKNLIPSKKRRSKSNDIQKREEFWALRDVSFNVNQGDKIGIIGRNGAGKSTLLKILSRITDPSEGNVKIKGRVASLLEVGTGFHQDLTGRENIFLNGAILGMRKEEIKRKFDEIVAFSEIEKFLDTPVKRYSSGMYVRLAFAVAAHLEPEILLIDEVLAVGDAEFQKKCLGKMSDISSEGRTILFVSHNMQAIQTFCNKAVFLNKGEIVEAGEVTHIVRQYLKSFSESKLHKEWTFETAPENENAKLIRTRVFKKDDKEVIEAGDEIYFEFIFYNKKENVNLDVTFHLVDEMGILVFVGSTVLDAKSLVYKKGYIKTVCRIHRDLLNEGNYTISRLLLVQDKGKFYFEIKDILNFEVVQKKSEYLGWIGKKEGVIKPNLHWEVEIE